MGPKKVNPKKSSEADEHSESSDKEEEQYVTKEFFNEQMQLMIESLGASIQANISDAVKRHVVESSKIDDDDLLSAAAGAVSGDDDTSTIGKSNIEQVMSPRRFSTALKIPKLEVGANFENWASKFIATMEIDYLGYLFKAGYSDPTTLDKNKRAALKRDKAYTRATLLQSVDESFLEIIRTGDDGESPGPAWWALKRHFVGSSAYDLRSVLTQLLTHKQGEDSLTSYIDKMNIYCTRLAAGDKPVTDETKLVYFLAGLHPRYANFKDVLEAPGQAALTYQDACAAVVAHHRRKFGDPSVAPGQSVAMLAAGGQDSRTCFNCDKTGHIAKDCRGPCGTCGARDHQRITCSKKGGQKNGKPKKPK